VYSAFDALKIAKSTDRQTVFLAIGFETTIAGIAATIETASVAGIKNLSFMTALKTVPPALDALISDPDVEIDGFILPGHVSAIIGSTPYDYIPGRGISGAICGFEPVDVLLAIDFLLDAINSGRHSIKNLYPRAVKDAGNQKALDLFKKVFDSSNAVWRGIGTIPDSGLVLKDDYLEKFDASLRFNLPEVESETAKGCQCGAVLKGQITPDKCPLFGNMCTPDHPVGPCMVSGEGSCAAYYRYGG
jgi:hydrogenase expression/formation protein HypD